MTKEEIYYPQPVWLGQANAQWSRRHASFFKTGFVTFVGTRTMEYGGMEQIERGWWRLVSLIENQESWSIMDGKKEDSFGFASTTYNGIQYLIKMI